MTEPFWRTKSLAQMTHDEWESLCDGCGRCCLHKLRDEVTEALSFTNVACRLLDLHGCGCSSYARPAGQVPDCVSLTPDALDEIDWLPPSCAYRRVQEGRGLAWWHPLVSGDPATRARGRRVGPRPRGQRGAVRAAGAAHRRLAGPRRPAPGGRYRRAELAPARRLAAAGAACPSAETIDLPHGPTRCVWRRSTRARRVSLRIDPRAAAVIVTLPPRAARAAGLRLLTDHAGWVAASSPRCRPPLAFADGAAVPVEGEPHRSATCRADSGGAWFEGGGDPRRRRCRLPAAPGDRPAAGRGTAPARAPGRATWRRGPGCSRPGSPSATRAAAGAAAPPTGTVMFNWRLVMAPHAVQHYVVVHELAHLRHMNHGAQFWALVAAERRTWRCSRPG